MKTRESWQHDWSPAFRVEVVDGQERVVKPCRRSECGWQMLSRKNSNRYRNGPDGAWMGSPKDCKGEQE